MKNYLLVISLFFASWMQAQSFQDFINYASGISDPGAQQTVVDSFMNALAEAPLLEFDTLAHFLYQGSAGQVQVAGDFNGWSPGPDPLTKIGTTNLWYRTKIFESNARLDYKLVLNGSNWILDPLNPHTVSGGFGPNSELAMPAYVQPWEIIAQPGIPHGTIETFTFSSTQLNGDYQVQVYLPPSYATHPTRFYPAIYVQDGQEYLSLGSAKNILDNLIDAGSISELVGIFIRPNNRDEEYAGSKRNQYRAFIVEELTPYIESHYRTIAEPHARAAIGTSYGANISAQIAAHHPDIFGKAGLHSPAFQPNNYETNTLLLQGGLKPIQWASVWGTYEGSVFQNMAIIQPGLEALGYEFYGNYYPEGHSWGLWRATLDEILIELFPPGLVSTSERTPADPIRISPNPALRSQTLSVSITGQPAEVEALLLDLQGQEVKRWKKSGEAFQLVIPENIPQGMYFLKLHSPKNNYTPLPILIF
ncbi:MAG: T9SS type A sorting domain-containing protein [Saprospirales bacterium]|nr:T9SS type A sorting domain-containing protein [Saprospirales bacterium]